MLLAAGCLFAQESRGAGLQPPWWNSWPFQAACVVTVCLVAWTIHRARVAGIVRRLNLRFEERLHERTRVAGELHDTLLQGFLSASMQLDVAADRLPQDSPVKPQLNRGQIYRPHSIPDSIPVVPAVKYSLAPADIAAL